MLIGNLVDNAGKWARHSVVISMTPEPWRNLSERRFFRVTIDDDGPGLAAGLRQAALSRGKRLDETKPGSGPGLLIVGDPATLYGGDCPSKIAQRRTACGPQAALGMRSTD